MSPPTIRHIRASVVRGGAEGGGGDYHDVGEGHWIDDHIATPMARYPEYRASRRSFGINVASMAGLPRAIIDRATALMNQMERKSAASKILGETATAAPKLRNISMDEAMQLTLFAAAETAQ